MDPLIFVFKSSTDHRYVGNREATIPNSVQLDVLHPHSNSEEYRLVAYLILMLLQQFLQRLLLDQPLVYYLAMFKNIKQEEDQHTTSDSRCDACMIY